MNKAEFILIHYYVDYDDIIKAMIIPTANN